MGRGLSELQKKILVLALFNAGGDVRCTYPPHLYTREVMCVLYQIEANFVSEAELSSPHATMRIERPVRHRRGWVFDRERWRHPGVKVEVYNSAIAAISRAFGRLESRGLVKRVRRDGHGAAGIILTPAGYQEALAQLKAIDPDRHQRVMSILHSKV
ncbi:MAG TPA: hypothetical protein VJR02_11000 [Pyrinomonadaceae bacterium]|nr:hypothetical protein [Pyrinomonadaceae bacterium]